MSGRGDIVQSIENAISVLDILMSNNTPMSLKDLSAVTKFPKSTLHGYLNTMRLKGLICQDDHGNYMLGDHLFEFGMSVYNSWDFVQLTNPILGRLTAKTGKSSILSTAYNDYMMNVNYYPSPNSKVQIAPCIGTRIPFHATAQGKVLLSGFNDKKIKKLIDTYGLTKYTDNTITDPELLMKEIEQVRAKGVAFVTGEYKEGNHVISVPVKDKNGNIVFSLAIMEKIEESEGPDKVSFYIKTLKFYAKKIASIEKAVFEHRY